MNFANRILASGRPYTLFHTHVVTPELLQAAMDQNRSMDLDICVNDLGAPYLGHSAEFYAASGERTQESMEIWSAVSMIASSSIPVIIDCKHNQAWPFVAKIVEMLSPERCLVYSYASELDFSFVPHLHVVPSEWSPIGHLRSLKEHFPGLTVTAGAKGLPEDLLVAGRYPRLLADVKQILIDHGIDTVCLNVPEQAVNDEVLQVFVSDGILPHLMVDNVDVTQLSALYVGETDHLSRTSVGLPSGRGVP